MKATTKAKLLAVFRYSLDDAYPGCPYCEQKSFIKCGGSLFSRCNKVSCSSGEQGSTYTCPWCGTKAQISGYIENMSAEKTYE